MPPLPFGEWLPDVAPYLNPGALEALNVVPRETGYGPLAALATTSNALTARCQGAFVATLLDGTTMQFAGDATKLYRKISAAPTTWTDVSRTVGGAYACPVDGMWSFAQFGQYVIACNGVDDDQSFDTSAGTNFVRMSATAPVAKYVATVRDQVFLANIAGLVTRAQWSPINDPLGTWGTVAATQADYQDQPDGGVITGVTGGDVALVFQKNAINRYTYQGSPLVYRRDTISRGLGCEYPGTLAWWGERVFFADASGFHAVVGGQQLDPIGNGKIDRYFRDDLDLANAHRISAACDPLNKLYVVAYPGQGSNNGAPNKLLLFSWGANRWSRALVDCEIVYAAINQTSYTLEQLDAFGTMETLPFPLDSSAWVGAARPLLGGFFTDHKSGYFNGANLAATIDTTETAPGGTRRALVTQVRPMVDGGAKVTVYPVTRNLLSADPAVGPAASLTDSGFAPLRADARFHRFRIGVASGSWTHASGIEAIKARATGGR